MHFSFLLLAAPEMLKGDVVGPPADIWSVGVLTFIMWVLLSQLPPSKPSLNRNAVVLFMRNEAYIKLICLICIHPDFFSRFFFSATVIWHGVDMLLLLLYWFESQLTWTFLDFSVSSWYGLMDLLWGWQLPLIFQVERPIAFHWNWSSGDRSQDPGGKVWPL